ncbi:hypothetical protein CPB84DRAFT_1766175 [Gymnopilus junonius]|uniref:Uncharacterized protein n=1 Tax=Gymnopilus junonius TaxID=109634 RepID=A0A9P5NTN5_GYMJU|nr:hypothetical protein CPB84DRAFT_1766175 [Gymnopilus junonius]
MSTVNPSAMLAESLSDFSRAAYQAFSEVEAQARMEVARSVAETREARTERDNAVRELHLCQLEVQSCKQEAAASKAALAQAELTIGHQAETLASQLETIAQLRREVTQWKDQSRNWQEHFLRVEQERCTQASRIDELVVERLQYPSSRPSVLFTPKAPKYNNGINSAPSTSSKHLHSPTQPPPYNPAALPSPTDLDPVVDTVPGQASNSSQKKIRGTKPQRAAVPQSERDIPSLHADGELEPETPSVSKRPRKGNPTVASGQKSDPPVQPSVRSSTIIRRVHAVLEVKREDDSEDESPLPGPSTTRRPSVSVKKKEESVDQQRYLRTPRPKIISDDEDEVVEVAVSDTERGQRSRQHQPQEKIHLRQRSRINYREQDDDDEEEDELMLGAEDKHDEIYATHPVEPQESRTSKQSAPGPPPKKRKLAAR